MTHTENSIVKKEYCLPTYSYPFKISSTFAQENKYSVVMWKAGDWNRNHNKSHQTKNIQTDVQIMFNKSDAEE